MRRTNKKGFTIVELVIVIAVIAILAAVLIPTFSSLVKKANLSADEQAVKQMNTALAIYTAENEKPKTAAEVRTALSANGVNGDTTPVSAGYAFYWSGNEIVLVSTDEIASVVKDGWTLLSSNDFGAPVTAKEAKNITEAITASKNSGIPSLVTLESNVTLGDTFEKTTGKDVSGNDVDIAYIVSDGESLIVDLNGKCLTNEQAKYLFQVQSGGTLTIKNGSLKGHRAIDCRSGGTVTLDNVTIESDNAAAVFAVGLSDISIVDSTITSTSSYAVTSNSNDSTHDGGRFYIVNSDLTSEWSALYIPTYSEVTIEGGTVTGKYTGGFFRGCNATISGTTFSHKEEPTGDDAEWKSSSDGPGADIIFASGGIGFEGYISTANYVCEGVKADTVIVHEPKGGSVNVSGITPTTEYRQ